MASPLAEEVKVERKALVKTKVKIMHQIYREVKSHRFLLRAKAAPLQIEFKRSQHPTNVL